MIRKLTVTLTLVLTSSLVIASSAFAVVPADSALGSAPGSGASTATGGDGSSWLGATIGVTLAVVGIAFLAAVVVISRNRRTALQP
jgi:hypothetical protein